MKEPETELLEPWADFSKGVCLPFLQPNDQNTMLIIGGGFAGVALAMKARKTFQVLLIDTKETGSGPAAYQEHSYNQRRQTS